MRYLFEATELTKTNYGRNEHTNIRKNIKHGGLSYYIYRLEVSVIICIRESAVEALCFVLFLILNTVHTILCLLIWMDGWMDGWIDIFSHLKRAIKRVICGIFFAALDCL